MTKQKYQLFDDLQGQEYEALKADIRERGVLVPVEIDEAGEILDGHHRVRAWQELRAEGVDIPDYPRMIRAGMDEAQKRMHIRALNIMRRHLSPEQRARHWAAMRADGMTLQAIADASGVAPNTVRAAVNSEMQNCKSEVVNARGQSRPATYAPRKTAAIFAIDQHEQTIALKAASSVDVGTVTATQAARQAKEINREGRREQNRALVDGVSPVREHVAGVRYQTIVLDPPWDWGDEGDVDQLGRARPTYATMTIDEIAALPIGDLASTNCHLYLWITNRSLPKGFRLLDEWGFRYITCLTWCKPSFGMGNYYRGSTEQILFGVRGSLSLLRNDVGTWFEAPRPGEHSSKPEEFYDTIELCSPGPWLEMFARKRRNGWVAWGAEA